MNSTLAVSAIGALVLLGCSSDTSNPASSPDASVEASDGAAGTGCQPSIDELVELLQQHLTCSTDASTKIIETAGCVNERIPTDAGLPPGQCGTRAASVGIDEAKVLELTDEFVSCTGDCLTCDLGASEAQCNNAACTVKN